MQTIAPQARPARRVSWAAGAAALGLHAGALALALFAWPTEPAPQAEPAVIVMVEAIDLAPDALPPPAPPTSDAAAPQDESPPSEGVPSTAAGFTIDPAEILTRRGPALGASAADDAPRPPAASTRAVIAAIARCRERDERRRASCGGLAPSIGPAATLVAMGRGDPRFGFGPQFAGLTTPEIIARLGGGPLMENLPDAPLAEEPDRRQTSIGAIRDRLPAAAPDPSFGD